MRAAAHQCEWFSDLRKPWGRPPHPFTVLLASLSCHGRRGLVSASIWNRRLCRFGWFGCRGHQPSGPAGIMPVRRPQSCHSFRKRLLLDATRTRTMRWGWKMWKRFPKHQQGGCKRWRCVSNHPVPGLCADMVCRLHVTSHPHQTWKHRAVKKRNVSYPCNAPAMLLQNEEKLLDSWIFPISFWTHPYQNRWNSSENWRFLVVHLRNRRWIHPIIPAALQDNDSDADASPSKVATSVVTAGTAKVKRKEGLMDLPASQAGAAGCCWPVSPSNPWRLWDINTCSISKVWGANRHTQEADKYFNPSTSMLGVRNFEPGSYKTCYVCRSSESLIISYYFHNLYLVNIQRGPCYPPYKLTFGICRSRKLFGL